MGIEIEMEVEMEKEMEWDQLITEINNVFHKLCFHVPNCHKPRDPELGPIPNELKRKMKEKVKSEETISQRRRTLKAKGQHLISDKCSAVQCGAAWQAAGGRRQPIAHE